jgi:hypothetical protein
MTFSRMVVTGVLAIAPFTTPAYIECPHCRHQFKYPVNGPAPVVQLPYWQTRRDYCRDCGTLLPGPIGQCKPCLAAMLKREQEREDMDDFVP